MKKTTAPPSEMTFLLIRKIKSSPRSLLEALMVVRKNGRALQLSREKFKVLSEKNIRTTQKFNRSPPKEFLISQ